MANDPTPMIGTSMSTPIVAGAAQTLVEALSGSAKWNYTRGRDQALLPKMFLLMTATETYPIDRLIDQSITGESDNDRLIDQFFHG